MKRFGIFLLVVLCLVLLIAACIGVFFLAIPHDIPPFDEPRLRLPPIHVEDGHNALPYYQKAVEALVSPNDTPLVTLLDKVVHRQTWDEPFVKDWIENNEPCFSLIAEGNRCRVCVYPPIFSYADDTILATLDLLDLWPLYSARIDYYRRRGETDKALSAALEMHRLAFLLQQSPNCQPQHLAASALLRHSIDYLIHLIAGDVLDDDQLRSIADHLQDNTAQPESFVRAYQGEYALLARRIDDIASSPTQPEGVGFFHAPAVLWPQLAPLFLQPNRTKREIADYILLGLDEMTNTYREIRSVERCPWSDRESEHPWLVFMKPNPFGRLLYAHDALQLYTFGYFCIATLESRALLTTIALHLYRHDHGTFPKNLRELVPEYLDEVPADPFDGQPLRYDMNRHVIYSIGVDLTDDGGQIVDPEQEPDDIVFQFLIEEE